MPSSTCDLSPLNRANIPSIYKAIIVFMSCIFRYSSASLYCSALGRILLIDKPEEEIKAYLANTELSKRTIHTKVSSQELLDEISNIKNHNIAIEIEEYEYGMTCIAGPIYDPKGGIAASLSVSGPATRISYRGQEKILDEVRSTCQEISSKVIG